MLAPIEALMQPNPYVFDNQGLGEAGRDCRAVASFGLCPWVALSSSYAVTSLSRTGGSHGIPFTIKGRSTLLHGNARPAQVHFHLEINVARCPFLLKRGWLQQGFIS